MRNRFIAFAALGPLCIVAYAAEVHGTVTLSRGRPGAHAVVYLEGGAHSHPLKKAVVDQRDRHFTPHISVVTVGTQVQFPNSDTIFHNVFADYNAKRFDLGMYPRGQVKRETFEKPGVVALMCSVHPDMSAFIMVVDTPYYTIADASGHFTLSNVSPGTYTLRVWHESGQVESRRITVQGPVALNVQTHRA